ncbi:hypothetical protein F0562_012264 [Nyssa sinensis]|uniref:Uncharacterized protein n=1 Tax=Nyssa sinensis TaxID=561372 RepID=A0A5J4ZWV3_9ASTE|nr:hypothetical protein F0562_012264 [Nyssa sinensis]
MKEEEMAFGSVADLTFSVYFLIPPSPFANPANNPPPISRARSSRSATARSTASPSTSISATDLSSESPMNTSLPHSSSCMYSMSHGQRGKWYVLDFCIGIVM